MKLRARRVNHTASRNLNPNLLTLGHDNRNNLCKDKSHSCLQKVIYQAFFSLNIGLANVGTIYHKVQGFLMGIIQVWYTEAHQGVSLVVLPTWHWSSHLASSISLNFLNCERGILLLSVSCYFKGSCAVKMVCGCKAVSKVVNVVHYHNL